MKKINLFIISVFLAATAFCQNGINYQAIVRDNNGNIEANQAVEVGIEILQGNTNGEVQLSEIFNETTNTYGLVNVVIGSVDTDGFDTINWSSGPFFIEISIDGTVMGTTQLLAVPYAKYADKAGSVANMPNKVDSATYSNASGISYDVNCINCIEAEELAFSIPNPTLADVAAEGNAINSQIKNLSNPTDEQDAATKAYVDQLKNIIFAELEEAGLNGIVKDFEGNLYKTKKIGDQIWMAENLKTAFYSDGTPIPEGSAAGSISDKALKYYFWYDNDSANNEKVFGKFYTWEAIMNGETASDLNPSGIQGICPDGWHLPSDMEWKELEEYLGMPFSELDLIGNRGTIEGDLIKESDTTHWATPITNSNNKSGFTALPAGYRQFNDTYQTKYESAYFWSCSELNTNAAYIRILYHDLSIIHRNGSGKTNALSVRCIKD